MADLKVIAPGWSPVRGGRVRGAAGDPDIPPPLPPAFLTASTSIHAEQVLEARPAQRGAPAPSNTIAIESDLPPGHSGVLVLRHASHALTFHRPDELERTTRGGPATVRFTARLAPSDGEPATRGVAGRVVRAILVKVAESLVDKAVEWVLPKLARAFETHSWHEKGLAEGWLRVTDATLKAGALATATPSSAERSLLFIHGTFSNAASAFSPLAGSSLLAEAPRLYKDRLYAFDHFTLSRTPEENARMLLEGLPDRPFTFDVITHSRGGLVLRNLVERAAAFGPLARRFRLGRVVLVASPNEGTPLATPRRLEDTLGWIANLLEAIPGESVFTTGPAFVANGLVWLGRHAAGDLPGLASMDGDGAMIRALQGPPGPPADAYSALVANYQPSGRLLARLLDAGLDQFFGSANDLVVPSEGGWRIDRAGSSFIPGARIGCYGPGGNLSGDAVTHTTIFGEPGAADFILRALDGQPQPLPPLDPARQLPDRRLLRAGAAGIAAPPPVVGGRPAAARRARMAGPKPPVDQVASRVPPFDVAIVNGDLAFERPPLLVGHYQSAKLSGAEWVIDRMTAGALSESLALGVYPSEPGTHQIFVNTHVDADRGWLDSRPAAIIVVGLGQEGGLRPAELTHSVRQGVLAWVRRVVERQKEMRASRARAGGVAEGITIASTLLGSGGSGITAAQAALLIVQGVSEANALLTRGMPSAPLVSELRLIELYTDRATEAWNALRLHVESSPGRFRVREPIVAGTGPLFRPLQSSYRGANYDCIVATTSRNEQGERTIEYALDTRRARTEVRAQVAQARLIQNLVTDASSHADPDIGRVLYRLLVPTELEGFLSSSTEAQIVLDEGTAGIPWELLQDDDRAGKDQRPWAVRAKLLRRFKTMAFREHPVDAEASGPVLVIGEPECPPEFARLPGAHAEAQAVRDCLQEAVPGRISRVEPVMAERAHDPQPAARSVIGALLRENWRIVHVAGHGVPPSGPGTGGVVLSDGTFLGPAEIRAMRVVPELVFVNCCHIGSIASGTVLRDRAGFAASVARELIAIGVRCVVAAGWAVDDEAARVFAETFYGALLRGERFIDAIARARETAYESDGHTWAAYQCYGDPDWRLVPASEVVDSDDGEEFDDIGSIAGLKLALRTIFVESTYQQRSATRQLARLRRLEDRWTKMAWPVSERVGERFADAYAASGDVAAAVRWYDRVIGSADGHASLRAFEQRSNLRVRIAWKKVEKALPDEDTREAPAGRARKTGPARRRAPAALQRILDDARRVILREQRQLTGLERFGTTAERLNLLGAAMKRLALVERAAGRPQAERAATALMTKYYEAALEDMRARGDADRSYPAINLIVGAVARGSKPDRLLFDEARESLREKNTQGDDFWSVVAELELELYEAVSDGTLAGRADKLRARCTGLAGRARAGWLWDSVYDTARFALGSDATRKRSVKEGKAAAGLLAHLKKLAHPT